MPEILSITHNCCCCLSKKEFKYPEEKDQVDEYETIVYIILSNGLKLKMGLCPACFVRISNLSKIEDAYRIDDFLKEFSNFDIDKMIVVEGWYPALLTKYLS